MTQEKNGEGKFIWKVLLIFILLVIAIVITASYTWQVLLPWMANHYSFALPGENGLPYRIMYNGRSYFNSITCASAAWCEEDRQTYPNKLCRTESEIRQQGEWPLVQVSEVRTLWGDPYPIMADAYILRKPVPYGRPVYGMVVYVPRVNGCCIEYQLVGGP